MWKLTQKNIPVVLGAGLTILLILFAWLNTTAMPVVVNVGGIGVVIACTVLLLLGFTIYRSLTRPTQYRGTPLALVCFLIALVSGGWFLYDAYLSFHREEVTFSNENIVLAGTVYLPTAPCPCPAAVLIHGSGRQTRDEYRYYARNLAQRGIIALAYDKRGTGGSTGELYAAGYREYAQDALAGALLLSQRNDVISAAVGLIGFSEGEWVAPLAYTAADDKPGFIIVVGPSGLSPADQVQAEIAIRLHSLGFDPHSIEEALALNDQVLHFQRTGLGRDTLLADILRSGNLPWFTAAGDIPGDGEELGMYEHYVWWRAVMDTNPDSIWADVYAPVLFIKGGKDSRSTAELAEQKLRTILESGGNRNAEFVHFPGADHMILEWPFGAGVPPPVFSDGYPDILADWIRDITR